MLFLALHLKSQTSPVVVSNRIHSQLFSVGYNSNRPLLLSEASGFELRVLLFSGFVGAIPIIVPSLVSRRINTPVDTGYKA